jgi:hypothetical protein
MGSACLPANRPGVSLFLFNEEYSEKRVREAFDRVGSSLLRRWKSPGSFSDGSVFSQCQMLGRDAERSGSLLRRLGISPQIRFEDTFVRQFKRKKQARAFLSGSRRLPIKERPH